MENIEGKQRRILLIQKLLIFLFLGLCFYMTSAYVSGKETVAMAFGEERTAQELLLVWDDDGEVYPVGKLAKLDLNEATEEELMDLPNIGEVLAKRILEYREEIGEFASILELDDVVGIGEKTIAAISDYICV